MLHDLISLFFPTYCLGCQIVLKKSEQEICTVCLNNLPLTDYHQVVDNAMAQKFYGRVPVTYAMAFCRFGRDSRIQKLIYQLKYGNRPQLGELLGRYYGAHLAETSWLYPFHLIIPVPLHEQRLRQRGYNQSDYFAQGLSKSLHLPWKGNSLQRIKHTATQTSQNKLSRLQNLANAFYVADKQLIQDKHILLVDDVVTTGATLEACCVALLEAGAQQVSLATLAITT